MRGSRAARATDAPAAAGVSRSFAPVADPRARWLIVGSLPGRESLARREYYAQPRNAFWSIMGALFGAGPELPYAERLARLVEQRVSVWDVCAAAQRPGSLDTAIRCASVVINDFQGLFTRCPGIGAVLFNGTVAAALYERLVLASLDSPARSLPRIRLPSTSPANASIPYARKLAAWRRALAQPGTPASGRAEADASSIATLRAGRP
ncbi:MAG: DNA-deoxyinosine glycosylase [Gammaproteobacteria bacterium]|nr:DNA-deoxyinosine glycosylase [Gammaproteobacteria bacterium]